MPWAGGCDVTVTWGGPGATVVGEGGLCPGEGKPLPGVSRLLSGRAAALAGLWWTNKGLGASWKKPRRAPESAALRTNGRGWQRGQPLVMLCPALLLISHLIPFPLVCFLLRSSSPCQPCSCCAPRSRLAEAPDQLLPEMGFFLFRYFGILVSPGWDGPRVAPMDRWTRGGWGMLVVSALCSCVRTCWDAARGGFMGLWDVWSCL